jgi:hypothetical protein
MILTMKHKQGLALAVFLSFLCSHVLGGTYQIFDALPQCPSTSVALNVSRCRGAARALAAQYNVQVDVDSFLDVWTPGQPEGCWVDRSVSGVWILRYSRSIGDGCPVGASDSSVLCASIPPAAGKGGGDGRGRSQTASPAATPSPSPTQSCPAGEVGYRAYAGLTECPLGTAPLSEQECRAAVGQVPSLKQDTCVSVGPVRSISEATKPEGCILLQSVGVWFNEYNSLQSSQSAPDANVAVVCGQCHAPPLPTPSPSSTPLGCDFVEGSPGNKTCPGGYTPTPFQDCRRAISYLYGPGACVSEVIDFSIGSPPNVCSASDDQEGHFYAYWTDELSIYTILSPVCQKCPSV